MCVFCVLGAVYTNCEAFVELGCVCVAKHYRGHITGERAKASVFNTQETLLNRT